MAFFREKARGGSHDSWGGWGGLAAGRAWGAAPRAWGIVALLWFAGCLNFMARTMVATMHGPLVSAFPMTEARFGLLTAGFLIAYGAVSPMAGFCSDRFSRAKVIWISMLVCSALTWMTSRASTYGELLGMRLALGVTEAFYLPAALALIADFHGRATRSLAVGLHLSGTLSGVTLGSVGGWLSEIRGWTFAFRSVGLAGFLYVGLLVLLLRDAPQDRAAQQRVRERSTTPQLGRALSALLGDGAFLLAAFYWALLGATSWGLLGWLPMLYHEQFGMSPGASGFNATAWSSLACVVGLIGGGALADRWSRTDPSGPMKVPAIALFAVLPFVLGAVNTHSRLFSFSGLALYGLAGGCASATMMPILCLIADSKYRATGYGILNMVGTVAGGVAIYAGGALRDQAFNLRAILTATVMCMALCPFLLLAIKPRGALPT